MDIDLTSSKDTSWKQMQCPRNESEKTDTHILRPNKKLKEMKFFMWS
ncbi:MAG: hypothetical protein WCG25_03610 [bacterium]